MTRARARFTTVVGLIVLCGAFSAAAQGLAERRVADLGWLTGTWVGNVEAGDVSEETWTTPVSGSMLGMWRLISGGKPRVLELLAMTEEDGRPVLRLRHFDGAMKAWEERDAPLVLPLVVSGPAEAAFESPGGTSPLRITYRRLGATLITTVEGRGAPQEYRFSRR
ncbi:MAG: DUF6265 family protein [Acidobacteriota bacterium]